MDRYIGIDAHATSCTIAVIGPSGRKLDERVVETQATALVECIQSIPRPRHLCLEEGTQSAWLYQVLSPHVDELVVAGTTDQRKDQKSDRRDALARAQELRLGAFEKIVFKAPNQFALLRQLAQSYDMITRDVVRTQCRLRALYLSRGVHSPSKTLYGATQRDQWLGKLPASCQPSAQLLYAELDAQRQLKDRAEKQLVSESHRYPISRLLETCPGLGPIRVALLIPVVVTPARFRTARQFWSYCGLGIVMRTSSDWIRQDSRWIRAPVNQTRGLSRSFNHTLKYVFKGAATTVIALLPDHPLHQHYDRMLAAGIKPNLAKLTLARQIAAIALAMWKHEEEYDPARHRKP
jgi:transposase